MSSTLPTRRPRHSSRARRRNPSSSSTSTAVSTSSASNKSSGVSANGWLCMPCLPQDILDGAAGYEATIVARQPKTRDHCAFTDSQAMGLALILAEQYVRASEPCPATSLETIADNAADDDDDGFVQAQWHHVSTDAPHCSVDQEPALSLTCSPHMSERSFCQSPLPQQHGTLGLRGRHAHGYFTLPVRSTRTRTASTGGSTLFSPVAAPPPSSAGAKGRNRPHDPKVEVRLLGSNRFRRPAQWIRSLFA
ncbi:hypothetical protein GGI07_004165 [Coemansia sp. Benny D115]|nr:hypothetical protein GGI07_004165 [Coemansia sp. Benny D115]